MFTTIPKSVPSTKSLKPTHSFPVIYQSIMEIIHSMLQLLQCHLYYSGVELPVAVICEILTEIMPTGIAAIKIMNINYS